MIGIGWIAAIVVGILAGWIAEKIMKRNHGLLTNLVVGIVGAIIGNFLLGLLHMATGGLIGNLIAAVLGAVILLAALDFFKRRR